MSHVSKFSELLINANDGDDNNDIYSIEFPEGINRDNIPVLDTICKDYTLGNKIEPKYRRSYEILNLCKYLCMKSLIFDYIIDYDSLKIHKMIGVYIKSLNKHLNMPTYYIRKLLTASIDSWNIDYNKFLEYVNLQIIRRILPIILINDDMIKKCSEANTMREAADAAFDSFNDAVSNYARRKFTRWAIDPFILNNIEKGPYHKIAICACLISHNVNSIIYNSMLSMIAYPSINIVYRYSIREGEYRTCINEMSNILSAATSSFDKVKISMLYTEILVEALVHVKSPGREYLEYI